MNTKVFNQLQQMFQNSPHLMRDSNALNQAIAGIWNISINTAGKNVIDIVNEIDQNILEYYFTKIWQPKTKKYKYSGLAIVDEINAMKPRSVLDVGCGYNEFKGKIHNLIGVDAFNDRADVKSSIIDYNPGKQFDVVISLGSINFGSAEKVFAELEKVVSLTTTGGLLYFRVNPGETHDPKEAKYIDFFNYDYTFILNSANALNCEVMALREDANRIYFVWKTK